SDPPESWPLDLVGVVGWYNDPQMMPRYMADFLTNQAPADFLILNPADGAEVTSLDDPEIVDMDTGTDTVKAMFFNWTEAVDIDAGDTVTYQMMFIGDGPEEELTTRDTFMYIPLNEEKPYEMNGTYTIYIQAKDLSDATVNSDTVSFTFDFPAPPVMVNADVVLVDGVPKYFAEFDLPLDGAAIANFSILDLTAPSVVTPTAVDSIAPNAVMISAPLVEDNYVALVYTGLTTPGAAISVTDTTKTLKVYIPFSDAHPEDAGKIIESFEVDTGTFWDPNGSGSTSGILDASAFAVSDSTAYQGEKSGMLTILDDPATDNGWYVRLYHQKTPTVSTTSTLMFLVKGSSDAKIEMSIAIADPAYELGPWKTVSLCENDWQIVSFDLANDVAEGWYNGDGVVDGSSVTVASLRIRSSEDADVVLFIDGFTERQILEPVNVTLNVMMDEWLRQGKFNLATDFVDVAGNMNDWGGTPIVLGDLDGDTTYTAVIPLLPYTALQFKFRINGSWNDATAEFPYGGPARILTVRTYDKSYTYWYNDDTLEVAIDGIPVEFALHQNYPNPFNPVTTINFDMPSVADVKLVIYDITGRKVRTLVNESSVNAGYKKIVWNGRDDFGNGVSTGMYIYRLIAGDFVDVKKMTFLK
ncbi:MAG: T9SS type A sorting domain-containing protein, partial [Candidatus Marinimicrobia bacterium]|nr:T9SS type A sorting domain-containing protein [Candidatus Neomarinimicrobiota bacterium]